MVPKGMISMITNPSFKVLNEPCGQLLVPHVLSEYGLCAAGLNGRSCNANLLPNSPRNVGKDSLPYVYRCYQRIFVAKRSTVTTHQPHLATPIVPSNVGREVEIRSNKPMKMLALLKKIIFFPHKDK